MTAFVCFFLNAAAASVNVALYVANPNAVSAGCIAFSAAFALFFLVMAVNE